MVMWVNNIILKITLKWHVWAWDKISALKRFSIISLHGKGFCCKGLCYLSIASVPCGQLCKFKFFPHQVNKIEVNHLQLVRRTSASNHHLEIWYSLIITTLFERMPQLIFMWLCLQSAVDFNLVFICMNLQQKVPCIGIGIPCIPTKQFL